MSTRLDLTTFTINYTLAINQILYLLLHMKELPQFYIHIQNWLFMLVSVTDEKGEVQSNFGMTIYECGTTTKILGLRYIYVECTCIYIS